MAVGKSTRSRRNPKPAGGRKAGTSPAGRKRSPAKAPAKAPAKIAGARAPAPRSPKRAKRQVSVKTTKLPVQRTPGRTARSRAAPTQSAPKRAPARPVGTLPTLPGRKQAPATILRKPAASAAAGVRAPATPLAKASGRAAAASAPASPPGSPSTSPPASPRAPSPSISGPPAPLRLAIFGASGMVGSRVAREALARGHHVTAIMRNVDRLDFDHPRLTLVKADAADPVLVAAAARDHDVVVSAVAPPQADPGGLVALTDSLARGTRLAGVPRLVVVNGAGSLEVAPGHQLLDTPQFPAAWRGVAVAHRDALEALQAQRGLDWTAVSPPALIEPGVRTGGYQTGRDGLLTSRSGESRISAEDFAVAVIDEVEKPRNRRRRMTVAWP